jgi:hypothetical protein
MKDNLTKKMRCIWDPRPGKRIILDLDPKDSWISVLRSGTLLYRYRYRTDALMPNDRQIEKPF